MSQAPTPEELGWNMLEEAMEIHKVTSGYMGPMSRRVAFITAHNIEDMARRLIEILSAPAPLKEAGETECKK